MLAYIHIPFCDSKCHYCAFNSYVDKFHLKQSYMQALLKQLHHDLDLHNVQPDSIETLFIGGGTPSTIPPELYKPIFNALRPYLQHDAEITSEANPNSASREWLEGMQVLGVNRISFGVQSFNDKKLKFLNRAHSKKDALKAIHNAWDIGIQNLSLDLIYGTVEDTKQLLMDDLKTAFELPVNHLSAYALTIESGTPFEKTPRVASEKAVLTNLVFETIAKHGFTQYEISNFGTYQSRHNLGYWQYKEYLGIGSGAVGSIGGVRYYPHSDIDLYIKDPLYAGEENLTEDEKKDEKILLGLRSIVGVDLDLLNAREMKRAEILLQENKLHLKDKKLYNPDYLLSDELALFITTSNYH